MDISSCGKVSFGSLNSLYSSQNNKVNFQQQKPYITPIKDKVAFSSRENNAISEKHLGAKIGQFLGSIMESASKVPGKIAHALDGSSSQHSAAESLKGNVSNTYTF